MFFFPSHYKKITDILISFKKTVTPISAIFLKKNFVIKLLVLDFILVQFAKDLTKYAKFLNSTPCFLTNIDK